MRCTLSFISAVFCLMLLQAQSVHAEINELDYLPSGQNFDPSIPLPSDVLGYPLGTWHVRHDQLVQYMYALAEASERVTIQQTGLTHEHRPLLLLSFSSKDNLENIETIKSQHLSNVLSGKAVSDDAPLVLYMGYSVHGNESSGANAALMVAYYLAASQSEEVTQLLNENVVLLDPVLNPDGLSRFAQWANMHKGKNLVSDPTHREHREHWPSGRTNHYWFDLNRDWLLLSHPESQARIKQFHAWRPHVLTDFHEMGTNSTYFFQPGIPSRKNPLTPETNVSLTGDLASFHAKALDKEKELYFTQESFDDFYYGKGSTYPDAHGSIGILFEQASSRGHLQESVNGLLSFSETIKNQVTTSLSTFAGAMANKSKILAYQRQFYDDTQALIKKDKQSGYIIAMGKDKTRVERMVDILQAHKIDLSLLDRNIEIDDIEYKAGEALYISLNQSQYRLLKSLFSVQQRFEDNTFYDVSNWNIAFAFNLDYQAVSAATARKISLRPYEKAPDLNNKLMPDQYAYAFEWFDSRAPSLLQALLSHKFEIRVAGADFSAITDMGEKDFARGTIVIPMALSQPSEYLEHIKKYSDLFNIKVHTITSGLTRKGIDLGSRQFAKVTKPEVLLIGGKGTSSYEAGEVWHYLDTRLGIAPTIWDLDDVASRSLDRYSHIIFVSGRYNKLSDSLVSKIDDWISEGGVLIGQKTAVGWFSKKMWINNNVLGSQVINEVFSTKGLQFADKQALAAKKLVAGAVYQSKIDLSHPLFFGFERDLLPTFKTNNLVLESSSDPFVDIGLYENAPLKAGYSADEIQDLVKNTASFVVNKKGRGAVVAFVDNVHFRAYWDGTNKLTANALFLSPLF